MVWKTQELKQRSGVTENCFVRCISCERLSFQRDEEAVSIADPCAAQRTLGAGQYLRPPAAWGAGALDGSRAAAGVVGRQARGALRIGVSHALRIQAARTTTDAPLQLCV
jgi:hypothetical protein